MKFRDANGREWTPRITVKVLREWEARTGVKTFDALLGFVAKTRAGNSEKGEMLLKTLSLVGEIFPDFSALSSLAWLACMEEAITRNVSEEDFHSAIGVPEMKVAFSDLMNEFENVKQVQDVLQSLTKGEEAANAGQSA